MGNRDCEKDIMASLASRKCRLALCSDYGNRSNCVELTHVSIAERSGANHEDIPARIANNTHFIIRDIGLIEFSLRYIQVLLEKSQRQSHSQKYKIKSRRLLYQVQISVLRTPYNRQICHPVR